MTRDETTGKTIGIASAACGTCAESIGENASFRDDLGLDSLEFAGMVMDVERQLKVDIPWEVLGELGTVGKLVDYVCGLEGAK